MNRALKSNSIEIGKIELGRYQTFFEIDKDHKDDFIKNIKKIDFKGNDLVLAEPSDLDQNPPKRRKKRGDRRNRGKRSDSRNSSRKRKKKKSRFR